MRLTNTDMVLARMFETDVLTDELRRFILAAVPLAINLFCRHFVVATFMIVSVSTAIAWPIDDEMLGAAVMIRHR